MVETEVAPERKARKSVAFTDQQLVVDADGSVTMVTPADEASGQTAVSHSPPAGSDIPALDGTEEGALDLTLKKKKKKVKKAEEGADGEDGSAPPAGGDDALNLGLKKKKKKKPKETEDEFAAKLAKLELEGGKEGEEAEATPEIDEGDMEKGTGIWGHDVTSPPIPFELCLRRFYHILEEKNPDHATSGTRSYKIPPPQCLREGNKKTIFANIVDVAKRMKRTEDHLTAYLFAELGTTGSVDGMRRLVIKGRFQQKQIENVLRKYILEYVVCKTCRSPDTELSKGENRLYFITCNSCGSRRSVTAIKTGFSAQVTKRKKQA